MNCLYHRRIYRRRRRRGCGGSWRRDPNSRLNLWGRIRRSNFDHGGDDGRPPEIPLNSYSSLGHSYAIHAAPNPIALSFSFSFWLKCSFPQREREVERSTAKEKCCQYKAKTVSHRGVTISVLFFKILLYKNILIQVICRKQK